jgi:hypothetical protein
MKHQHAKRIVATQEDQQQHERLVTTQKKLQ